LDEIDSISEDVEFFEKAKLEKEKLKCFYEHEKTTNYPICKNKVESFSKAMNKFNDAVCVFLPIWSYFIFFIFVKTIFFGDFKATLFVILSILMLFVITTSIILEKIYGKYVKKQINSGKKSIMILHMILNLNYMKQARLYKVIVEA
jgi:hypothetical protein